MKARPVARAALPVALMCLLAACETLDRLAFGPEPTVAANPVVATPLPAGTGYPTVNTVPPRPQLSYSIEQERAIVEALISDREHANYTSQVTRYRTGRSDLPPPPLPVPAPAADAVVPAPAATPAAPAAPDLLALGEGSSSDDYARTLEPEQGVLDDGSLNDFVRELVNETDTTPGLSTETAVIDQRAQDAPAAELRPGRRESNFPRLFSWIARQFSGADDEPAGAAPEDPASAEAATGVATAADEGAPVPAPADATPLPGQPKPDTGAQGPAGGQPGEGEPAAEPDDRPGDQAPARAPVLKPDESADPPEPAPEKPDRSARAPAGVGTVALLERRHFPGQRGWIVLYPPSLSTGRGVA